MLSLSPAEFAAWDRGQTLKRYVRAAAALAGLFDDTALADAVGRGCGHRGSGETVMWFRRRKRLARAALHEAAHELRLLGDKRHTGSITDAEYDAEKAAIVKRLYG